MDFVSTKRTLITLAATLVVAVSIPASVFLFKSGYFDIRNQASEGDDNTADTIDGGAVLYENIMAQWNFNEQEDLILYDVTIHGNNGTLNGFDETGSVDQNEFSGWTQDNAKYSGALMFDGTDDFISVSDKTSFRLDKISISVWFKTNEDGYLISKYQNIDPKHGFALIIDSDVMSCWVGGGEWLSGNTEVTDGEWHNAVCTYDGTSVKLYVDGILDDSDLQEANMSHPASLTIGAFDLGSSDNFEGVMDCVQIYDIALSEASIKEKITKNNFEYTDTEISEDEEEEVEDTPTADLDEDGNIGINDYYLFTGDYDSFKGGGTATERSDLDQDGDIDMDDYTLFFEEYSID